MFALLLLLLLPVGILSTGASSPAGFTCGSSNSRGHPGWSMLSCGAPGATAESAAKACGQKTGCVAFNIDKNHRSIPCFATAASTDPDSQGDLSGRWVQCKQQASLAWNPGATDNYARTRGVVIKQSTMLPMAGYGAFRAADGSDRTWMHTAVGVDNAWWAMQFPKPTAVALIRITNTGLPWAIGNGWHIERTLGLYSSGLVVKVGTTVCTHGLDIPGGMTVDIRCPDGTTGTDVTVLNPGKNRILRLAEVEAYGPAYASAKACYKATAAYPPHRGATPPNSYRYHAACATCSGPGPTQCKSCPAGSVLAVWDPKAKTGSCHLYGPLKRRCTRGERMRSCDGPYRRTGQLILPSFSAMQDPRPQVSTRWTIHNHAMRLPVNTSTMIGHEDTALTVVAFCRLRKTVACVPQLSNGTTTNRCTASKAAELMKAIVAADTRKLKDLCCKTDKSRRCRGPRCHIRAKHFSEVWHGYRKTPPVCKGLVALL